MDFTEHLREHRLKQLTLGVHKALVHLQDVCPTRDRISITLPPSEFRDAKHELAPDYDSEDHFPYLGSTIRKSK